MIFNLLTEKYDKRLIVDAVLTQRKIAPKETANWYALIISAASTILLILRTALEDHTLQTELSGYIDYARQVRYRLLPGIW